MALQIEYRDGNTGVVLPEAYHRVLSMDMDFGAGSGRMVVAIYRDGEARRAGNAPYTTQAHRIAMGDGLARTDLYALLRADPSYAGAVNV